MRNPSSIPDSGYLAGLLRSAAASPASTHEDLTAWLYHQGYVVRHPRPAPRSEPPGPGITESLIEANRGRPFMDAGWRVEHVAADGSVIAAKGQARRRFRPGEYLTQRGPGGAAAISDSILIHAAVECRPSAREAFYFSFGEAVSPFGRNEELVRLYWNVSAAGAPALLASVTGELNRFQVPFSFKCLHRAAEYFRLDSAVLYIHRHYWPIASRLLPRIHRHNASALGSDGPPLTKPLAPGLNLAEDPGGGVSFGMHRCAILARAVRELRLRPAAVELEEASRQFSAAGLRLELPFLNPGAQDLYELG